MSKCVRVNPGIANRAIGPWKVTTPVMLLSASSKTVMSEYPMTGLGCAAKVAKSTRSMIRLSPLPPRRHQMPSIAGSAMAAFSCSSRSESVPAR